MSRRIILGVSGGIAAYKVPELVRILKKKVLKFVVFSQKMQVNLLLNVA